MLCTGSGINRFPKMTQFITAEQPLNRPQSIAYGTLVTTNLALTRKMLDEFLGLDCQSNGEGKMFVRDNHLPGTDQWVFEIAEVDAISHPQHVLNHLGFDVASKEEVDRANKLALEIGAEYGIVKVQKARIVHGVYAFYFKDFDDNWWEIQCRLGHKRGAAND